MRSKRIDRIGSAVAAFTVALFLLPVAAAGQEGAVSTSDFAYIRTFTSAETASLYRADLPEEVLRTLVRADLGDMRVFNAAGIVVPHELEQPSSGFERSVSSVYLPFFPIEGSGTERGGGSEVHVSEDPAGRVLSVRFAGKPDSSSRTDGWYLVNLRAIQEALSALTFEVSDLPNNQVVTVAVEASEDLIGWSRVRTSGVLAKLSYQNQLFQRSRVELESHRAKFLKVQFETQAPLALTALNGELVRQQEVAPVEHRLVVEGELDTKSPRTVLYDSHRHLPVRSVAVLLPEQNSLVEVRIDSRTAPDQQWTQRFSGSVYRLSAQGGEVESPAFVFPATVADRFWRLRIEGRDMSTAGGVPKLSLGWYPVRVLFLARGRGPFQLAYGSAAVGAPDFGMAHLPKSLSAPAGTAVVGPVMEAGGAAKLERVVPEAKISIPWKRWILWGAMSLFVAMIAAMAYRLWKDLQKEQ